MAGKMQREKHSDTEKITLNLGFVDLGRIDVLVQDGFYSNRSDFIRTAIRRQLEAEAEVVSRAITRKTLDLGLREITRSELEAARAVGERLNIRVVGLVRIATDVSVDLAVTTIATLTVLGALQASAAVKAALTGRIR
jgi:Arc/MetJ-type ribon-helix-helix transcriptional regulator